MAHTWWLLICELVMLCCVKDKCSQHTLHVGLCYLYTWRTVMLRPHYLWGVSVCVAGPMNKTFQRDTRGSSGSWVSSITEKHKSCWLTSTRPRRSSKTRFLLYKYCKSEKCVIKSLVLLLWAATVSAFLTRPRSFLFFCLSPNHCFLLL